MKDKSNICWERFKIQTYVQYGFADFFALMHTSDDTCLYLQHYAHGLGTFDAQFFAILVKQNGWFNGEPRFIHH